MPVRTSDAVWTGAFAGGSGIMKFGGGAWEGKYTAGSRFDQDPGTNPEELIAAAHAGCYSMALAADLGGGGHAPEEIATTAKVHIEKLEEGGWTITKIELQTRAKIPGIDADTFKAFAEDAKKGCPVSRLLTGAEIILDAQLVS